MSTLVTTIKRRPAALSHRDRARIINELCRHSVLKGTERRDSLSPALAAIVQALATQGYTLDFVPGDVLLGDKGTRTLTFRRANGPGDDPFSEHPTMDARVVFVWENLGGDGMTKPKHYECLAYLS